MGWRLWKGRRAFPLRALVVFGGIGILVSCAYTSNPATGDPKQDLQHEDPKVRIETAVGLAKAEAEGEEGRPKIFPVLFPLLLDNLSHPDVAVRFFTGIVVRKLTGLDVGYRPYGSPSEQEEAIAQWRAWGEQRDGNGANPLPPASGNSLRQVQLQESFERGRPTQPADKEFAGRSTEKGEAEQ